MPLDFFGDPRLIAVERALLEFRAARPVAIRAEGAVVLALPVEALTENQMPLFEGLGRKSRIVVPREKIRQTADWTMPAAAVTIEPATFANIESYAGQTEAGNVDGLPAYRVKLTAPSEPEIAALALANLSLLLPAVIVTDASAEDLNRLPVVTADARAVMGFRGEEAKSLKIVARTFVPLEGAGRCEFVVFRGGDGFRDQVAVIVGNPSAKRPVLARIHSACLTGDLFGSLKCDCGDQLRGTVRAMSEQGGGVVLYLDQEGRGNGIANKIRAYALQEEGFDTYDADQLLGFGHDQRRFDFAAAMLKQLGFTAVRLMTNNPHKIAALREAGLNVVSTHRVLARTTPHNAKYLAAKRDKGGHLLGDAALDGYEFEDSFESAATQS